MPAPSGAGPLRHRISIQAPGETLLAGGETAIAWSELAEVWASIEPLSGREFFLAQQVQSDITLKVRIRWLAGVTAKHRIVGQLSKLTAAQRIGTPDVINAAGGRVFDIQAPPMNWQERNVWIELFVREHL